ncbi:MAG: NAD-dependent epimerase/dehydratase family protein [Sporichthyaceae bacterium]
MHVLVTGGAGFIGSHIVSALAHRGHQVRVLDSLLPAVHPVATTLPTDAEFRRGDLRDVAAVAHALEGIDAVCHQAAMVGLGLNLDDAPDYVGANDLGTAVLLAAMARTRIARLVLASSMVVYGEGRYACQLHGHTPAAPRQVADLEAGRFEPRCSCGRVLCPELVDESAPLDPRNVYAATKVAQEHLCAAWARATGGRVAALRYHNVYGPRMPRDTPYAGVAAIFRSALADSRPPQVFEDGAMRRDFVHVRDVAGANLAALAALTADGGPIAAGTLRPYNVGSGTVRTVAELARALSVACGGPAPVVTGAYRLGDVRHITASSDRLRAELGWRVSEDFTAGMAEFAAAPLRGS